MTEEFRSMFMDSIMDDVYALLRAAAEAGDENACRAIFEEWQEYLIADDTQPKEVTWIDVVINPMV
jgi:hypothetical protein